MRPPARLGRALRLSGLAMGLGVLATVLPLPGLEFATVAVGRTQLLPVAAEAGAAELGTAVAESGVPLAGARVAAVDPVVEEFTAIGLTFERRPVAPVLLRVRDADGAWGRWRAVDVSVDEGPDGTASAGTDAVWVGGATGYEVNLGPADAPAAEVVTVHDELRRSTADATPVADAAVAPPFAARTRAAWGARATASSATVASTVRIAVVHHSASGNTYTAAEVPAVLRSVQAFHMDGRGWSDMAYNFVVDRFGTVWEGRAGGMDRAVVGAHAMGFNTGSVGVMVLGDFTQPGVVPSAAVVESVSRIVGWKLALHRADPASRVSVTSGGSSSIPVGRVVDVPRVVGHKDVGATGCPGSIYAALPRIRARAQEWTTWIRSTTEPVGTLESVRAGAGTVTASGFANDPDVTVPVKVRLRVAGQVVEGTTTVSRPDVRAQARFAAYPLVSGFVVTAAGVPPGYREACLEVVDQGIGSGDVSLGCRPVRVADPAGAAPSGTVTGTTLSPGTLGVAGRVADPQAAGPLEVDVLVDGAVRRTVTTNRAGELLAQVGGVVGGSRTVCLKVRNVGEGADTVVDCRTAEVPVANPRGAVDLLAVEPTGVRVRGWAVDDEFLTPTWVAVTVDGRGTALNAAAPRPDRLARFPLLGERHGFDGVVPAAKGTRNVCVTAHNLGGGRDTLLVCRRVVVK